MATILILLFFIFLVSTIIMVSFRVQQIRKIRTRENNISNNQQAHNIYFSFENINFTSLLRKLFSLFKKNLNLIILFIIKMWIKIFNFIIKKIKDRFPKAVNILNGQNGNSIKVKNRGPVSFFLKTINEYKVKIKKIKEEIKKEDRE